MPRKAAVPFEREGREVEAKLQPMLKRLAGCELLLGAARTDIEKKIKRAKTAYAEYHDFRPKWRPREEWSECRTEMMEDAVSLSHSSTIGRALDELKEVRSYIREVERDLERLMGPSG